MYYIDSDGDAISLDS